MSIPGSASPLLLASTAAAGGLQIERSLRFNPPDTSFLNRTPSVASNRRTWTWSGWIKRGRTTSLGEMIFAAQPLYICFTGSNSSVTSPDRIALTNIAVSSVNIETTAVFRDFSAWFHLLVVLDTTQSTSSDRVKIYVNGQLAAISYAVYPSLSEEMSINSTLPHGIGRSFVGSGNDWDLFSGYLANIHFIDGQALTPSSFTEIDATTGQLIPKAYTGSYGTNGFNLLFADNSSNTASTLGKDTSGLSNNWTPNNLSVTAGAGNDSLVDSPTNYGTDTGVGGEVRGNYCTLNPLSTTSGTFTQGNLRYTGPTNWRRSNSTVSVSTGKWYWEVTLAGNPSGQGSADAYHAFGFGLSTVYASADAPSAVTDAIVMGDNGYYKNFSGAWTNASGTFASGSVLSIAVDLDLNTFTFRHNNTSLATGTIGGTAGRELTPVIVSYNATQGIMDCNFGQRAFAYTAPSGFKALCTQNLPSPLVTKSNEVFDVTTYTGNGAAKTITGLAFSPDLVWMKVRSTAYNHTLIDSVRGATKTLSSSMTVQEYTEPTGPTAFTADGWSMSGDVTYVGSVNASGQTYVGWAWDAGTSTVSNTQGSITSQVRANATAGFSVVTYSFASAPTVGHGLGAAPSLIIAKSRTAAVDWVVYHRSLGKDNLLVLNDTGAAINVANYWGTSEPSSTVFGTYGTGGNSNNQGDMVAYCFTPVVGYSSFGSYTGNGSADGPFVYTGFRPRWILIKHYGGSISDQSNAWWMIVDTARDTVNVANNRLHAQSSNSEYSGTAILDVLSNGFKLRFGGADVWNYSGGNYLYVAFAEAPFNYSRAR